MQFNKKFKFHIIVWITAAVIAFALASLILYAGITSGQAHH